MEPFDWPIIRTRREIRDKALLRDYSAFLILHALDDLLPVVDSLIELGCEPSAVTVVGIPYSSRRDAARRIESMRCDVHLPEVFPFEGPLLEWLRSALERTRKSGKRLIIAEDGGYAIPLLCQLAASGLLDTGLVVGAVEQTTRGARIDQHMHSMKLLPWPVISIPPCGSKGFIEPPYIAEAVHRNLLELLDYASASEPAGVVLYGSGTIGIYVASALQQRGSHVSIGETAADRRFVAYVQRRFPRLTPERLESADLILGTSGFTTVTPEVLNAVKDGAVVASASSRQIEIDVQWLQTNAVVAETYEPAGLCPMAIPAARRFNYAVSGGTKSITLLYEGYPINFWGVSLPDHVGDAIMALVLEGIMALATGGAKQPGVWSGATVLQEADQTISELWISQKPDDGIDPYRT